MDSDEEESESYPGYTKRDLWEQVTFIRPYWDYETDSFQKEGKYVEWCLDNGFQEVRPGVWSGPWYFEKYPDESPHVQPALRSRPQSTMYNIDPQAFEVVKSTKQRGNDQFVAKNFRQALELYTQAEEKLGGKFIGVLLSGEQRAEMVKILSNKAECHFKLGEFDSAVQDANVALAIDKKHVKSLLRRSRATFRGAKPDSFGLDPFACSKAMKDCDTVIYLGGEGVEDAKKWKKVIEARLERDLEGMRRMGIDVDE